MSRRRPRHLTTGLALGLVGIKIGAAQDIPALPIPPQTSPFAIQRTEPVPPRVIPKPTLIEVPPEGIWPTWGQREIDPIALERHQAKHVGHKSRSWLWRRFQGKTLGYPEEFEPRPLGAALHDHGRTMVANGAAARLVLFHYDFIDGSSQLNPRGRDQLAKVAAQLAVSPYPLLIERTLESPGLAESRRTTVLNELAAGPIPIDPSRVLVGLPSPTGLAGIEAEIIYANALDRTRGYGPPIPINSNGVNSPTGVTTGGSGTTSGR